MGCYVNRSWAWTPEPYDAKLPPPLCFTEPDGDPWNAPAMVKAGAPALEPRQPKMMMDPSDPATWQRPYRFTDV